MATFESDLGKVTAYAYAVDAGYQGTEAEFEEELLNAVSTFETDKTLSVEDKAADAKMTGEAIDKLKKDLNEAYVDLFDNFNTIQPSNFELGNIRMATTGWTYSDSNQRVRTKEGVTYHLTQGAKVGLSDYTDAQYYLGWLKSDGTYNLVGWLQREKTIDEEGDYVFLITNKTAKTQSSIYDLLNLLYIETPDNIDKRLSDETAYVEGMVDDLKVSSLFNYTEVESETKTGLMSTSGTINTGSANNKRIEAEVSENDLLMVSGVNPSSAYYPLYILMHDSTVVSYYREDTSGHTFMTRKLIVPANVNKIVVNQITGFGEGSIKKAGDNIDAYEEIKAKTDTINPYYTDTNEVLWIGTSIPEGATYPQKACEANGYKCINRSLGSSKLCFENTYISGSDVNKGKRLTATVAELEALYRADVTAGTITEATLNMWKNYSYENSILPYINGTNPRQVSMIVIDHGYNDRGIINTQMQDVNNIDWDSVDRATFTGAFKYLLNKIQEINPFIKIVISGYFTNTVNRLAFSYFSPQICEMQELIGEHYDIYVMKAWEHTQINPVHVAGTSNYLENFNAQYGTSYTKITPDAEGNITALQLYCPDGIHPHTDKTGRCNKRLNAVYTKLLAHTI